MKTRLIGLFVAGVLALTAPMTKATIITYAFTAEGGHSGSFSYDNANTTTIATPPFFDPGGSYYNAISFTIDGVAPPSPVIHINNDNYGVIDCASAGLGQYMEVLLCASPPTLFSSEALSELDNRQLSDFGGTVLGKTLYLGLHHFDLLTLTFTAPEPGTLALLGFGLTGLGFSRRKR